MTDVSESRTQIRWRYLLGVAVVTGLLWWADGRLWPSMAAFAHLGFWLVMLLKTASDRWAEKSRLGRVVAAIVDGIFFWLAAEWLGPGLGDGRARPILLLGGGVVAALIVGSIVWNRLPVAWRERMVASKIARGAGAGLLVAFVGGFLWVAVGVTSVGDNLRVEVGLVGVLLALAGGLALALWRLDGWRRALACWAIASLAWIGLMTGMATGVALDMIGTGGWLLAIVPPLIAGAVVTAYWRINKAYRV